MRDGSPQNEEQALARRRFAGTRSLLLPRRQSAAINLGRDFGEAMRQYGALFTEQGLTTFGAVCDRYLQSPDFARISERSRTDYMRYLVKIRETFGAVPPRRITAPDVLKFRDLIWKKSGMVQANRHLELLKLLLRLATAWGVIPYNPAREVKKFGKRDGVKPWALRRRSGVRSRIQTCAPSREGRNGYCAPHGPTPAKISCA